MTPTWTKQQTVVVGIVLFVLAAVVRLALLHTARFGGDEALFFRIGMDIVELKSWPLLGTQITDGAARLPGPAFLYVMALPLVVVRAPEAQYAFVEVMGAVTVVIFWLALRRPYGDRAATLAAVFMACSPWATLYADRTWNPNIMPLFVVTAMWCALRVRERPDSRAVIALWPLLAVLPQLHMSAPVAWAGLLVLAGTGWLRFDSASRRRHHAIGLLLALLLYVPLIANEVITGLQNTRLIFSETVGRVGGERHPWGFVCVPVYALRFLTLDVTYHELTGYWGGPDELKNLGALFTGTAPRPFHPLRLFALSASLLLMGVVVIGALVRAVRARSVGPFGGAFIAALIANMLLMGIAAKQVFGHYVTNLYPFVVVGIAAACAAARPAWWRRVLIVLVLVTCVGGIEATLSVSRNVDAKIGLEVHRRATQAIVDDAIANGIPATEPVRLDFIGVRSSMYDWQIFVDRAAGAPFTFNNKLARRRHFALTPANAPAPRTAIDTGVDVGAARLWKLR